MGRTWRTIVGSMALTCAGPAGAQEAQLAKRTAAELEAVRAAIRSDDCARTIAMAGTIRRLSAQAELAENLRSSLLQVVGTCEARADRRADAYRDLLAATAFTESDGGGWQIRLLLELQDKRGDAAVATVEAMRDGHGAALNGVPIQWLYQFDAQLKETKAGALRRRLLAVLSENSFQPDEAGVGNDGFRWRYAEVLYDAGDRAAALGVAATIEHPSLLINLSLDPRFRSAFTGDLSIRPRVEQRLAMMREAAATHPDQLGPVHDTARLLRVLGRRREALAALEAIRPAIERGATFTDGDEHGAWYWNEVASAQAMLGDQPAAVDSLAKGAAIKRDGVADVGLVINLAETQLDAGRPRDALKTLEAVGTANTDVSGYGAMQVYADRGCAKVRVGTAADASEELAAARAHEADAPDALTRLLLCAGDLDGAAQSLIRRLDTPGQRVAALRDLSTYDAPPVAAPDPVRERQEVVKARADVQAAIGRAGGVRTFDVQKVLF